MQLDKAKSIDGWMSDLELEWLAEISQDKRIIIEFGCYLGRSTRAIADNTKAIIYAVDPFTDEYYDKNGKRIQILRSDSYEQFRANLKEYIESNQLEIVRSKSSELPDYFGNGFADFVFIDADHRYEAVKHDINLARKLVLKNGIIAGHDYTFVSDWPGVKQAVDEEFSRVNQVGSIWWVINDQSYDRRPDR